MIQMFIDEELLAQERVELGHRGLMLMKQSQLLSCMDEGAAEECEHLTRPNPKFHWVDEEGDWRPGDQLRPTEDGIFENEDQYFEDRSLEYEPPEEPGEPAGMGRARAHHLRIERDILDYAMNDVVKRSWSAAEEYRQELAQAQSMKRFDQIITKIANFERQAQSTVIKAYNRCLAEYQRAVDKPLPTMQPKALEALKRDLEKLEYDAHRIQSNGFLNLLGYLRDEVESALEVVNCNEYNREVAQYRAKLISLGHIRPKPVAVPA